MNGRRLAVVCAALLGASCSHDSTTAPVPQGSFHIVIQNVGPAFSASSQAAFDSAVAEWQRAITTALTPVTNFSTTANECGQGFPAYGPATINDIVIQVRLDSIDGPGKVLGHSGPCFVRSSPDSLPLFGVMVLDTADLASLNTAGHLNEVVLHEMAHVLGFGTLWTPSYFNCVRLPTDSTTSPPPDTYYACPHARAQFDSIGGTSYTGGNKVPVENCAGISGCGAGTYNSHWRENVFHNELMTGYLNSGPNPLSTLTIAAMADLGYVVNKDAAQAYSQTFSSSQPALVAASGIAVDLSGDVRTGPIGVVDRYGHRAGVIVR